MAHGSTPETWQNKESYQADDLLQPQALETLRRPAELFEEPAEAQFFPAGMHCHFPLSPIWTFKW